jgi:uncharacterized protein with HEPN domain
VKRLSTELREATAEVLWGDIAGMRDRLIHDDMGIDLEAVWKTAREDVPALREVVQTLLDADFG